MSKLSTKEAPILAGALKLLELRGFPAFRVNSGAMKTPAGRFIRFGGVGMSDLIGLVPGSGRMIAVETKRPGGKPTAHQIAFLRSVQNAGGVALICDDLARFDLSLAALQRDPLAVLTFDGERIVTQGEIDGTD